MRRRRSGERRKGASGARFPFREARARVRTSASVRGDMEAYEEEAEEEDEEGCRHAEGRGRAQGKPSICRQGPTTKMEATLTTRT
eukprot:8069065-Pyramimonas_sp.AAC.1